MGLEQIDRHQTVYEAWLGFVSDRSADDRGNTRGKATVGEVTTDLASKGHGANRTGGELPVSKREIEHTGSRSYSFVQAKRLISARSNAVEPERDSSSPVTVKLVQPAKQTAPISALGDIRRVGEFVYELECHFFGLFGSNGPLPEYVCELIRAIEFETEGSVNEHMAFVDFLNIFNHIFLEKLYSAIAVSEPAIQRYSDRDPYFGALRAIAGDQLDTVGDDSLRARFPLMFCGSAPTAEGLTTLLKSIFMSDILEPIDWIREEFAADTVVDCRVEERKPRWLALPDSAKIVLGCAHGDGLGYGAYLGDRVLSVDHAVDVCFAVSGLGSFRRFLPGGEDYVLLKQVLVEYLGYEFTVEVVIEADAASARGEHAVLGAAACELGRSTWLGDSSEQAAHRENREVSFKFVS